MEPGIDAMTTETREIIQKPITRHPVLIYMKGTLEAPQCGFSAQTVSILMDCGQPFAYVNILDHPNIRQDLPDYAEWPTFPQLWVDGALVGGCDIVTDLHSREELLPMLREATAKGEGESESQPT